MIIIVHGVIHYIPIIEREREIESETAKNETKKKTKTGHTHTHNHMTHAVSLVESVIIANE